LVNGSHFWRQPRDDLAVTKKSYALAALKTTLLVTEGATKCNPNEPQTSAVGTWDFNTAETALLFTSADEYSGEYTILELTSTSLKISQTILGITIYFNYTEVAL